MSEVLPLRMIVSPSSPSNRHMSATIVNNELQQEYKNGANNSINNKTVITTNKYESCKRWCHNLDNVLDDGLNRILSAHPVYREPFIRTHNFILRGDGPLSYAMRQYIAIMASARHQCSYLVNASREQFLSSGGDPQWLQGLAHIPQKLKDLNQINKLLAHQPWLLNKTHIEKLTKGTDSWSLSELVHAIVILSHFHALSSLVFGCNSHFNGHSVVCEEKENGHSVVKDSNKGNVNNSNANMVTPSSLPNQTLANTVNTTANTIVSQTGLNNEVETLMKKMQSISEQKFPFMNVDDNISTGSQEDLRMKTASLESLPIIAPTNSTNSSSMTTNDDSHQQLQQQQPVSDLIKFMDDPQFGYEDFARKESVVPTFRVQDYSWDSHGFSLVNRLYSDVGQLLDDSFKTCYNLTYSTMGLNANVDTSLFRRAIWNYIQCMFGIRHDDYEYREVNVLLARDLKSYIKQLCCYPHRFNPTNHDSKLLREFLESEQIHINLMIFEARFQSELLYALRAVMRHMT